MNLKKLLAATVLMLGTGVVFAQDVDEKALEFTQKAITQSLTIYQAHKDLNQLNDTDKAIDTALNKTLPGIFNQVENGSEELGTEMENAVTSLAGTLSTYQQLYPANMLNEDYAKLMTINVALTYAARNKLISEEVYQIIMEALFESMQSEKEQEAK